MENEIVLGVLLFIGILVAVPGLLGWGAWKFLIWPLASARIWNWQIRAPYDSTLELVERSGGRLEKLKQKIDYVSAAVSQQLPEDSEIHGWSLAQLEVVRALWDLINEGFDFFAQVPQLKKRYWKSGPGYGQVPDHNQALGEFWARGIPSLARLRLRWL